MGVFEKPSSVPIPGGYFLMGCAEGRDEERPVHRVWVDDFEMALFQVQNRDWAVFIEETCHPAPPEWDNPDLNRPNQPVVGVNWFEAAAYCDWLGRRLGRRYRLPAEAEWECAAHGGREGSLYPWGDEPPALRAEYVRRWGGEVRGPLEVGQGSPNPFGVYDLCENVHEWCADWFEKEYYARSPERNPVGPPAGERKASRGGSWRHHIRASRCATRSSIPPAFRYADYGFRVVCDRG